VTTGVVDNSKWEPKEREVAFWEKSDICAHWSGALPDRRIRGGAGRRHFYEITRPSEALTCRSGTASSCCYMV